jgi:ribA/ribD-fused uncharacterized protein
LQQSKTKSMYSLDWLKIEINKESQLKYLYFWGHTPANEGSITQSCLSQWWLSMFSKDGIEFKSTEHWMMYQKAILFDDTSIADRIIECKTPAEAKKLGRKVSNFDESKWLANRMAIVIEGNYLKFSQNEELKLFLLNTHDRILVEASPVDNIWGVGLAKDSRETQNPETWRGLNLLGFALMEVRNLLK